MFELTAPTPMASPYTPVGGSNMPTAMPQQPKLGTPIPGMTGGLAAKPGLNVFDNPLSQPLRSMDSQQSAQSLQQMGRNGDSMLVHMTPEEVNSLQGLAMAAGGSLTINPDTGLPEASFLKKLLPMLAGLGLNFFLPGVGAAVGKALGGIGAAAGTGITVGAGTAAITGDLSAGLSAGLGAFGGASLGGALKGVGSGAIKSAVPSTGGTGVAAKSAQMGLSPGMVQAGTTPLTSSATAVPNLAKVAVPNFAGASTGGVGLSESMRAAMTTPLSTAAPAIAPASVPNMTPGFLSRFGGAASEGMSGFAGKSAPFLAGMGVVDALTPPPSQPKAPKEEPGSSQYTSAPRERIAPRPQLLESTPFDPTNFDSSEQQWFTPTRPDVLGPQGQVFIPGSTDTTARSLMPSFLRNSASAGAPNSGFTSSIWNDPKKWRAAEGGKVPEFRMESGGHVFPAKAVAAYGNFDTEAGQRRLAGLGAIPIKGPGDGVSDSIPARIDGNAPARVASGEVYFPPRVVKRLGGTEKLYAMMRKAEKAANRAKSGEKVKGLA